MQEGGLRDQAYFRLKEVRPELFVGLTPEMEGTNFDIKGNNYNENDDEEKKVKAGPR